MSKSTNRFNMLFYPLIIAGFIIFTPLSISYAGSKILGAKGETGYSPIRYIGKDYLTTGDGRFNVSEKTKICNQYTEEIKLSDIDKTYMVNIHYKRINGELTALEINAKFEEEELLD